MAVSNNGTANSTVNNGDQNNQALMAIVASLEMEKVVDGRIVQISLGCLSAAMAILVIYRIWRDSWRSLKLNAREEKLAWLHQLNPAESFPLILGFSMFLQQVLFVAIQATTLNYLTVTDCRDTGMFIVPGVLGLSFLHFIFGLEMTFRALRKFPPMTKRYLFTPLINVIIMWILIAITVVVCKVTGFDAPRCSGGIVFLAGSLQLNHVIIGLTAGITFVLMVMALIIARQLSRLVHLDPNERVAGSRMVYYLVLAAGINAFILPYFVKELASMPDATTFTAANVAEYALFVSGTIIALLHLFLRANAARMAIKAKETPWHAKRRWRFFGPSELEIINISPPLNLVNPNYRPDEKVSEIYSRRLLAHQRKTSFPTSSPNIYPNSPRPLDTSRGRFPIHFRRPSAASDLSTPGLVTTKPTPPPNNRKSSVYTLWPGAEERRGSAAAMMRNLPPQTLPPVLPLPQVPAASYKSPGPVRAPTVARPVTRAGPRVTSGSDPTPMSVSALDRGSGSRHLLPPHQPWARKREVSLESSLSGTVPIGVRLSTAPDARISSTPAPSTMPSRLGSTIEFGQATMRQLPGSGAPFDETFSQAFQEQTRDARGRDLNSFRWIDSPTDDIISLDKQDAAAFQHRQQMRRPKSPSLMPAAHASGLPSVLTPPSEHSSTSRYSTNSIQQSPRFREGNEGGKGKSPWI